MKGLPRSIRDRSGPHPRRDHPALPRGSRAAYHRVMKVAPTLLRQLLALGVAAAALAASRAAAQGPPDPTPAVPLKFISVRPSEADPSIRSFDEPNLIVFNPDAGAQAPLAVFLPGTNGRPANVRLLLSVIASQGYRAIGLEYDDEPAVVQVCVRDPDPDCSGRFRQERIYGDADRPPVVNPLQESIVQRLVKLLQFLDRQEPQAHWGDYLSGDRPAWPRIVISGLSQGAGMAAYIAQREPVARVVLFSSPWDNHGQPRELAPWIAGPSVTPPERWFAEFHRREATAALIAQAYRRLGIPEDHVAVFDLDLPEGGRGPNPFHGSTVRLPGYEPQWRWLYGSATAAK